MAAPERVWPPRDPASVAPLNKHGLPDMCNYMPDALVYHDEAVFRGWKYFYEGRACPSGHIAPRLTSNRSACVDCDRVKNGRRAIGGIGPPEVRKAGRPGKAINARPAVAEKKTAQQPLEPTRRQKDFLAAYAELKDFEAAAKKVDIAPALLESELSYSQVFRDAYKALEERIGVRHLIRYDEDFEWDADKESFFVRTYVNTGLIESARDAIRVTNYDFEMHLKKSPTFAAMVKDAEPLVLKLLKGRALRVVMEGSPPAMIKILHADDFKAPEDKAAGMTDEQLNDEIIRTLGLAKRDANAGAFADVESGGEVPADPDDSEDVPAAEPESFEDLL